MNKTGTYIVIANIIGFPFTLIPITFMIIVVSVYYEHVYRE